MATNTEKIVVQVIVKGQKDLQQLEGRTKKATKGVGGLSKGMVGMAAGIGVAIAAFRKINSTISSAIRTFRDFEFQMAKVRAITGASDKDFARLSKTSQELGRTTFFTAQQVAELQTNFGKLGFSTKEIIKAQKATLDLATATDADLGRAAIVAGAAVRGFALDAGETQRVVDVMAVAFTSSALDIEKFQTSMTKVAPIAQAAGISIEATTAVMGTLTDAGIEASIAGTSLRNIFLKMQKPSSDLAKHLGFTVKSSADLQKALSILNEEGLSNAEIMKLVDLRQVAAFQTMINGSVNIKNLTGKFEDANGAAAEMSGIVGDNLEGAFKRLTSAWEGFQIVFAESILGKGLQKFIDGTAQILNLFTKLKDTKLSEDFEEQRIEMNLLGDSIHKVWKNEKQRMGLIDDLMTKYPEYFKDLDREKVSWEDLEKAMKGANDEFLKTIELQVAREEVTEYTEKIRDLKKEQKEATLSLVAMLTGIKKVGTTFLTTTNEMSTMKEATAELTQQWQNGIIDGDEYQAALLALGRSFRPYSNAVQGIIKLEKERQEVLDEIEEKTKGDPKPNGKGDPLNDIINSTKNKNQALLDLQLEYAESLLLAEGMSLEKREQYLAGLQAFYNDDKLQVQLDFLQQKLDNEILNDEERVALKQQMASIELNAELELQNRKLKNIKLEKDANIALQQAKAAALMGYLRIAAGFAAEGSALAKGIFLIQQALAVKEVIMTNLQTNSQIFAQGAAGAIPSFGLTVAQATALIAANNIMSALSIAGIVAQTMQGLDKKARGGMIEGYANGGMVHGNSHAQGGERFAVGGRVVELEGGEAVINKRSTSMFRSQLSAMNAAGGGVKFADGGLMNMPSFAQSQFNAAGQAGMMGAMSQGGRVVVVESDITTSQNTVSVIEAEATI